jgi:hypothetical protein
MSENVGHGWTNWRKTTLTDFLYGKAYVSGLLTITNAKLAVEEWLSGKLVAGSEKANSHNEVILKLLHELDYQQESKVKSNE